MAGPALATARELRAPGVPKLAGHDIVLQASTPMTSGDSAGFCGSPCARTTVYSISVQGALLVSSLSAQFEASRWSLCGSINSRLLPPPADHAPHRPPSP